MIKIDSFLLLTKNFQQTSFCLLAIVLLSATSCKKEDIDPVKKPVFRCKVNGTEWKAVDEREYNIFGWGTASTDLQYYKDTKFFEIAAGRELENRSTDQSIGFFVRDISIDGQPTLIPFQTDLFFDQLNITGCKFYDLDTSENHIIIVKSINTEKFIMEGTFQFSAINACEDTVHITDGYFNMQYRF